MDDFINIVKRLKDYEELIKGTTVNLAEEEDDDEDDDVPDMDNSFL